MDERMNEYIRVYSNRARSFTIANRLQLDTIMNQCNSLRFLITYFPQISFNIVLQILLTFPSANFTKGFPNQIFYVFTAFATKNAHPPHSIVIDMNIIGIPNITHLISVAVI
jgi:hypothetical protein